MRKVEAWPAKEKALESSTVADERTANRPGGKLWRCFLSSSLNCGDSPLSLKSWEAKVVRQKPGGTGKPSFKALARLEALNPTNEGSKHLGSSKLKTKGFSIIAKN